MFKKLLLLAVVFAAAAFFSCASVNKAETITNATAKDTAENTVKITGRVVVFGNEPFTYAGIVCEDGKQYAIYPQETETELRALQGSLIEFTVIFLEEEKVYGSMYLGSTVKPVSWEAVK